MNVNSKESSKTLDLYELESRTQDWLVPERAYEIRVIFEEFFIFISGA